MPCTCFGSPDRVDAQLTAAAALPTAILLESVVVELNVEFACDPAPP